MELTTQDTIECFLRKNSATSETSLTQVERKLSLNNLS